MKGSLILMALVLVLSLVVACPKAPAPKPPEPVEPVIAYPTKTITLLVPFSVGGGTDRWARVMATVAKEYFGQPWHVVNMPGASGIIGWRYMLERPADGHLIMLSSETPIIALLKEEKPPISPYDAKVVCFYSAFQSVVISKPGAPFATWEAFKSYVEKFPGKIVIGGTESLLLAARVMLEHAGIAGKIKFVPYASTTDAVADFLGGHIHTAAVTPSTALTLMPKDAVAVVNTSELPIPGEAFKGVPNAKDLGYKGTAVIRWVGVHPHTPDKIVDLISEKFGKLLKDKFVVDFMERMGEDVIYLPRAVAEVEFKAAVEALRKLLVR